MSIFGSLQRKLRKRYFRFSISKCTFSTIYLLKILLHVQADSLLPPCFLYHNSSTSTLWNKGTSFTQNSLWYVFPECKKLQGAKQKDVWLLVECCHVLNSDTLQSGINLFSSPIALSHLSSSTHVLAWNEEPKY